MRILGKLHLVLTACVVSVSVAGEGASFLSWSYDGELIDVRVTVTDSRITLLGNSGGLFCLSAAAMQRVVLTVWNSTVEATSASGAWSSCVLSVMNFLSARDITMTAVTSQLATTVNSENQRYGASLSLQPRLTALSTTIVVNAFLSSLSSSISSTAFAAASLGVTNFGGGVDRGGSLQFDNVTIVAVDSRITSTGSYAATSVGVTIMFWGGATLTLNVMWMHVSTSAHRQSVIMSTSTGLSVAVGLGLYAGMMSQSAITEFRAREASIASQDSTVMSSGVFAATSVGVVLVVGTTSRVDLKNVTVAALASRVNASSSVSASAIGVSSMGLSSSYSVADTVDVVAQHSVVSAIAVSNAAALAITGILQATSRSTAVRVLAQNASVTVDCALSGAEDAVSCSAASPAPHKTRSSSVGGQLVMCNASVLVRGSSARMAAGLGPDASLVAVAALLDGSTKTGCLDEAPWPAASAWMASVLAFTGFTRCVAVGWPRTAAGPNSTTINLRGRGNAVNGGAPFDGEEVPWTHTTPSAFPFPGMRSLDDTVEAINTSFGPIVIRGMKGQEDVDRLLVCPGTFVLPDRTTRALRNVLQGARVTLTNSPTESLTAAKLLLSRSRSLQLSSTASRSRVASRSATLIPAATVTATTNVSAAVTSTMSHPPGMTPLPPVLSGNGSLEGTIPPSVSRLLPEVALVTSSAAISASTVTGALGGGAALSLATKAGMLSRLSALVECLLPGQELVIDDIAFVVALGDPSLALGTTSALIGLVAVGAVLRVRWSPVVCLFTAVLIYYGPNVVALAAQVVSSSSSRVPPLHVGLAIGSIGVVTMAVVLISRAALSVRPPQAHGERTGPGSAAWDDAASDVSLGVRLVAISAGNSRHHGEGGGLKAMAIPDGPSRGVAASSGIAATGEPREEEVESRSGLADVSWIEVQRAASVARYFTDGARDPTLSAWRRVHGVIDVVVSLAGSAVVSIRYGSPAWCAYAVVATALLYAGQLAYLVVIRPYEARRDALITGCNAFVMVILSGAAAASSLTGGGTRMQDVVDYSVLAITGLFYAELVLEIVLTVRDRCCVKKNKPAHSDVGCVLSPASGGRSPSVIFSGPMLRLDARTSGNAVVMRHANPLDASVS